MLRYDGQSQTATRSTYCWNIFRHLGHVKTNQETNYQLKTNIQKMNSKARANLEIFCFEESRNMISQETFYSFVKTPNVLFLGQLWNFLSPLDPLGLFRKNLAPSLF